MTRKMERGMRRATRDVNMAARKAARTLDKYMIQASKMGLRPILKSRIGGKKKKGGMSRLRPAKFTLTPLKGMVKK